ncbi:MAG: LacI family DNA-binding transcriptional regulator [Nocardiopsaceae bacterium]|nr:LacI family DNA-binding transcriptional regulator [Nocardiopsaceae bacterium]
MPATEGETRLPTTGATDDPVPGDAGPAADGVPGDTARRAVTLRDVARRAGVHPSTASRVLSDSRPVRPELARAVRQAARELDYQVNQIGRALRRQESGTVGMVVPEIDNPFFPEMVQAIDRALHRQGLGLFLCDANNDPELEADRLRVLLRRQVDGVIISPVHRERSAEAIRSAAREVVVVQVDRSVDAHTDVVAVDQGQAIGLLIDHVTSLGRRRIAFITCDDSVSTAAERLAAYRARMAGDRDALGRVYAGDLSLRWGGEAVRTMMAAPTPLPDALICANDLIALGAMQRLRWAGVRVPDDIAVTGIDDTPFGRVCEPELTTVRQPVDQIGDEAVAMLRRRQHDPGLAPRRLTLSPELIIRRSTTTGGIHAPS